MAVLKDLLYKVSMESVAGNTATEVHEIVFDSRLVKSGDVFVAINGTQVDGHEYIEQVITKGVVAIVCENLPAALHPNITYIQVHNSQCLS